MLLDIEPARGYQHVSIKRAAYLARSINSIIINKSKEIGKTKRQEVIIECKNHPIATITHLYIELYENHTNFSGVTLHRSKRRSSDALSTYVRPHLGYYASSIETEHPEYIRDL